MNTLLALTDRTIQVIINNQYARTRQSVNIDLVMLLRPAAFPALLATCLAGTPGKSRRCHSSQIACSRTQACSY